MRFLIGFLFCTLVHAEDLQLLDMSYVYPAQTASCGMLKHRELERQKVIRELEHIRQLAMEDQYAALLQGNNLLVNKLFMPNETWRDLSAEVLVTVEMTEAMVKEALAVGKENLYLSFDAPGFIWQSYVFQIPQEMHINVDTEEKQIHIRYLTYYNVLCLDQPKTPVVEWIKSQVAPLQSNTADLFRGM